MQTPQETIGFEKYPLGRRITRWDVENYALTMVARNGHDLEELITAVGSAVSASHAYDILYELEVAQCEERQ